MCALHDDVGFSGKKCLMAPRDSPSPALLPPHPSPPGVNEGMEQEVALYVLDDCHMLANTNMLVSLAACARLNDVVPCIENGGSIEEESVLYL